MPTDATTNATFPQTLRLHVVDALTLADRHPVLATLTATISLAALVFAPFHLHLIATDAHYLLNFLASSAGR